MMSWVKVTYWVKMANLRECWRPPKRGRQCLLILWGPPGTGKTTIARLLAAEAGLFSPISAVFEGVADLRKVFAQAESRAETGEGTLLFVDEVHRFNKAQQDGLLPHVEDGRGFGGRNYGKS